MSLPVFTRQLPLHGVDNLLGDSFAATDPFRLFTEKIYPLLAGARGTMARVLYKVGWGEQCAGCPLKDLCLGKNQTQRSLEVGEHHSHLQQRRKDQKTAEFKEKMHRRSAIEGTQSELVRGDEMRQARYRGLEKVRQQNYLIGAACNVKRWIKRMVWEMGRQANCALAQATGAVEVS